MLFGSVCPIYFFCPLHSAFRTTRWYHFQFGICAICLVFFIVACKNYTSIWFREAGCGTFTVSTCSSHCRVMIAGGLVVWVWWGLMSGHAPMVLLAAAYLLLLSSGTQENIIKFISAKLQCLFTASFIANYYIQVPFIFGYLDLISHGCMWGDLIFLIIPPPGETVFLSLCNASVFNQFTSGMLHMHGLHLCLLL